MQNQASEPLHPLSVGLPTSDIHELVVSGDAPTALAELKTMPLSQFLALSTGEIERHQAGLRSDYLRFSASYAERALLDELAYMRTFLQLHICAKLNLLPKEGYFPA